MIDFTLPRTCDIVCIAIYIVIKILLPLQTLGLLSQQHPLNHYVEHSLHTALADSGCHIAHDATAPDATASLDRSHCESTPAFDSSSASATGSD